MYTISWEIVPAYQWFVILVNKLCPTLMTPWTVACQAPLSMGFPEQKHWNGFPFPSPNQWLTQHKKCLGILRSILIASVRERELCGLQKEKQRFGEEKGCARSHSWLVTRQRLGLSSQIHVLLHEPYCHFWIVAPAQEIRMCPAKQSFMFMTEN